MFCRKCGKEMEEGALFCVHCGAKIEESEEKKSEQRENSQVKNEQERATTVQQPEKKFVETRVEIPPEYKPISMWGYFGYEILFLIPCIGFILLLVFAFGGTSNVNLKNFARSYFCVILLVIILSMTLFLPIGMTVYNTASSYTDVGILYTAGNVIMNLI